MRGRPAKPDATQAAASALELWLQGQAPREWTDAELADLREALGESQYAVDETERKR